MRTISNKTIALFATAVGVAFSVFYFYTSGLGVFSAETHRGFYLLGTFILCLIYYPANKKHPYSKAFYVYDAVVLVLSCCAILYWITNYVTYSAMRVGLPSKMDIFWGVVMILCSLEVTRRVLGNILVILAVLFVVQLYYGPYLGSIFAHKAMSWTRIFEYCFMTMEGMFGTIVNTFATYVVPFLIFGAFLEKSGAGEFFIDLAKSLTGRIAGGPALIAVFGSCVFGSISGSSIANVVATGSFTIPMMKKIGYKPEFAGAVEAAASTGGQFMPPIMGAGAFILASLTQTPYGTIAIMALVPALMYYLSVGLMVYFQAKRSDMRGMPREELPRFWDVIKKGWYFVLVLAVAIVVIVIGYSAPAVAFYSTLFVIACSCIRKENRFTLKKFAEAFNSAAKSSLMVGSAASTLGLVMAGITLAGLGVKFSQMLLLVSRGSLIINIFMILLMAVVIGMGLPTTASYILMAILAAPSLVSMGVPMVQAHMMVFWLAMTSNVTPPVCVCAFAGASIAGADPMKTGIEASKLAAFLYIMPFTFAYRPALLLIGTPQEITISIALYIIACFALGAGLQGWLGINLNGFQRAILLADAIIIMLPLTWSDIVGTLAFAAMVAWILIERKRRPKAAAAG
jgi:TRAP transporter 4TM/12TM fusion protein